MVLIVLLNFKGEYIVPESVSEINAYAFSHCEGLTSITFPDNLLTIGENAFGNCSNLALIKIPSSVKSIGGILEEKGVILSEHIIGTNRHRSVAAQASVLFNPLQR